MGTSSIQIGTNNQLQFKKTSNFDLSTVEQVLKLSSNFLSKDFFKSVDNYISKTFMPQLQKIAKKNKVNENFIARQCFEVMFDGAFSSLKKYISKNKSSSFKVNDVSSRLKLLYKQLGLKGSLERANLINNEEDFLLSAGYVHNGDKYVKVTCNHKALRDKSYMSMAQNFVQSVLDNNLPESSKEKYLLEYFSLNKDVSTKSISNYSVEGFDSADKLTTQEFINKLKELLELIDHDRNLDYRNVLCFVKPRLNL